jgi:GNAT superfamily N-acetyltransferase
METIGVHINTAADGPSAAELADRLYDFAVTVLGNMDNSVHTRAYYRAQAAQAPSLLVYAEDRAGVVGCILGSVERDHILVGPTAVASAVRRRGIGAAMLRRLEVEARRLGQATLIAGALREAEGFYLRCGFRPHLFAQLGQAGQLERLKALNPGLPAAWEWQDDSSSRLMLVTGGVDHALQEAYQRIPGCHTQYVFIKELAAAPVASE